VYYLRFADLLTDADILEISAPFNLDRRIIQPGALSVTIPVPNSTIGESLLSIVPQKTVCHVYRGDMILGSYVVWAKTVTMDNPGVVSVGIQGSSLESFFYRRRISEDLVYTGEDQLDIAAGLVADAQIGYPDYPDSADLGIEPVPYAASGVDRDRTYLRADGNYAGDLLEALANVDDGFEYIIHTWDAGDGSGRVRRILFGYPSLAVSSPPIVLEQPGNILSFSILYDGTAGATVFTTRGKSDATEAGEEDAPLESDPAFATEYLDNGWPILDRMADYQNVTVKATLDSYAEWWASARGGPIVIPDFVVSPGEMFEAGFSPVALGAETTVVMNNPAYPTILGVPTWGNVSRIIGFELTVDEAGKDSMKLVIESSFDPTDIGG
jgi:hypothetical protein